MNTFSTNMFCASLLKRMNGWPWETKYFIGVTGLHKWQTIIQ